MLAPVAAADAFEKSCSWEVMAEGKNFSFEKAAAAARSFVGLPVTVDGRPAVPVREAAGSGRVRLPLIGHPPIILTACEFLIA
jgi:hypothetical protein